MKPYKIEKYNTAKKKPTRKLFKVALLILGIIISFSISRIFIVPIKLHNDSMEPNFSQGTKLIVLKHFPASKGNVIVFRSPIQKDKVLFGRIIAAPHETVEVKDKNILINGKKMVTQWEIKNEDSRIFPTTFSFRDNMSAIKLEDEEWFILCDNIDFGFDSRELGPINKNNVIGRIIYPRKK